MLCTLFPKRGNAIFKLNRGKLHDDKAKSKLISNGDQLHLYQKRPDKSCPG